MRGELLIRCIEPDKHPVSKQTGNLIQTIAAACAEPKVLSAGG